MGRILKGPWNTKNKSKSRRRTSGDHFGRGNVFESGGGVLFTRGGLGMDWDIF